MITKAEAQAKFREYHYTQGSYNEVYTEGFKMKGTGARAAINCHFQNGEKTCRHLSYLPDNSTIFNAEATAVTGTGLLSADRYSMAWCSSLLWLNVLLADD